MLLVPSVDVTESGVREWEPRAVAPGTSTVTGGDADDTFAVTVA